jgi:predicted RNase H-like nuclease (RuvC/YqgF family)
MNTEKEQAAPPPEAPDQQIERLKKELAEVKATLETLKKRLRAMGLEHLLTP